jgi:uncharacterized protein (DUF302 family)
MTEEGDAQASGEGLITRSSAHDFQTTLDRLTGSLHAKGVTIFAVIDHAAGAQSAGLALEPTTVVVFGDPRAGTPLMQARQSVGIDLPLKVLVWRDAAGAVRLTYNDPAWIARRHGLDPDAHPPVAGMSRALAMFVQAATDA